MTYNVYGDNGSFGYSIHIFRFYVMCSSNLFRWHTQPTHAIKSIYFRIEIEPEAVLSIQFYCNCLFGAFYI